MSHTPTTTTNTKLDLAIIGLNDKTTNPPERHIETPHAYIQFHNTYCDKMSPPNTIQPYTSQRKTIKCSRRA